MIQPPEQQTPEGWGDRQDSLARATGLSLLLVAGHQPPALHVSNNNSICQAFQSSAEHAHLCEPYCGQAYKRAMQAGTATHYRCHAGLHCFAAPVATADDEERPLAVIGGRAFLRSADYRALAERIRAGDLADLLSEELFRNVIFASRQDLDELAERVEELSHQSVRLPRAVTPPKTGGRGGGATVAHAKDDEGLAPASDVGGISGADVSGAGVAEREPARAPVVSARLSRDYFSQGMTLDEACRTVIPSLVEAHAISSVALLLRGNENFVPYCVTGQFIKKPPRISLKAKEIKLLQAATGGESIAVPLVGRASAGGQASVELFPLVVGQEIKGALLVGEARLTAAQRRAIGDFCREVALPLEILRLREELERRSRATTHLQAFTESINAVAPEDAYSAILRHSAELLHAERGSLLMFDETANELSVKAMIGPRAEFAREARVRLGDAVSGSVFSEGRPLVVRDINAGGQHAASPERSYKSGSFISYPITVGGRKIGVLNVTDKAGGGVYDEIDLGMLELIAPQMALALDRAEWHQKATQFQLLSITDPLTGLLNRRYLEERLSEELERSKRHRFAISFMMMDIDDFKNYNDRNGHQAGDLALEMTAQCLKSALRSADVAARYGGEEFSILLPQTNQSEALVIAERIRRRVERTHYPHGKTQPLGAVTVSIGVSSFGPNLDTPASVIHAADQALYIAKNRGKNCVDAFTAAPPSPSNDAERNAK
ncbi:MAG TPA: diguanylate cyclase [Pyrinomonadaceae bacterium]|nr:diguanylate cyclase [Pyrinomonadaceae bacterium]